MKTNQITEYVTIANTGELNPGERLVVEYGQQWIIIFNIAGKYYAIEDVCTHDDGPLADGNLIGCTIECPRHGATFDVATGKVLSAPALVDVKSYEVRIQGSEIQISEW